LFMYAVHAILDILCFTITILDPYIYNFISNIPVQEEELLHDQMDLQKDSPHFHASGVSINNNNNHQNTVAQTPMQYMKNAFVFITHAKCWKINAQSALRSTQVYWEYLLHLYPSLFNEEYNASPIHMQKAHARVFMYWIVTMSVVRIMAICMPCIPLFLTLSVIYFFEFFIFQYEGLTLRVFLFPTKAKIMSILAISMSFFSSIMCIWVF
jgi:hypothetical protein